MKDRTGLDSQTVVDLTTRFSIDFWRTTWRCFRIKALRLGRFTHALSA